MDGKFTIGLIKTGVLMAAITGLFLVIGFLLGGMAGILIALGVAIGMNAYAYWNSDQLALKWHNARVVTPASAPAIAVEKMRLFVSDGNIQVSRFSPLSPVTRAWWAVWKRCW